MPNQAINRPSINTLVVFESVGRCQSFSKSALELGVSQPAISLTIGRLEKQLNTALFLREHRGVSLTRVGKQFFDQISRPIGEINSALDDISQQRNNYHVTLCVSTAFATYCLLPKIVHFKQLNPDIKLRCLTTDSDLNHPHEQADLTIPLGLGDWPNYQRWPLVEEAVMAVCSKSYLNTRSPPANVVDLLQHSLLGLDTDSPERLDWRKWLNHFDVECQQAPQQTSSNDYSVIIQAAMEGQGIALGWRHIVAPLIADGRLVQVLPHTWVTENPFYLLAPRYKKRSPATETLRKWLIKSVGS